MALPKEDRKNKAPMPMAGAGLIRFFEDETHGIKIKPVFVIAASIATITGVILAHIIFAM